MTCVLRVVISCPGQLIGKVKYVLWASNGLNQLIWKMLMVEPEQLVDLVLHSLGLQEIFTGWSLGGVDVEHAGDDVAETF